MRKEEISYARSKLLMVNSFFGINTHDAAVIWSAFNVVDHKYNDTISIRDFAKTFCPKNEMLFTKIWDKYTYRPPDTIAKVAVQHVDEDDMSMTPDEVRV